MNQLQLKHYQYGNFKYVLIYLADLVSRIRTEDLTSRSVQDSLFTIHLQHLRLVLDLIVIYFLAVAVSQVREANAG